MLLGSVATAKYLEPIADVLGDRLFFPRDFIGRGDMSRGALLLQRVDANHELDYVPFATGIVRRGPRAPGVAKPRSSKRATMDPRDATPDEIDALAHLWFEGWRDAHATIVPVELVRLRTLDNFRDRLRAALGETRVIGPRGAPLGFTMLKGDEVYQLYVSRPARGSGVAAALIADAEQRLAARGVSDGVAGVRDRQRAGGTVLREARMASRRHGGQRRRNVAGRLQPGCVALREDPDAVDGATCRETLRNRVHRVLRARGSPRIVLVVLESRPDRGRLPA